MDMPVELTLPRDQLIRAVTQNIAALHRRGELPLTAREQRALDAVRHRQEAFLTWLVNEAPGAVCLALFCAEQRTAARSSRRRRSAAAA